MIGRRMANIIKRFARHRDNVRLANLQRVRGLIRKRVSAMRSCPIPTITEVFREFHII
jgi:hypothetical protein